MNILAPVKSIMSSKLITVNPEDKLSRIQEIFDQNLQKFSYNNRINQKRNVTNRLMAHFICIYAHKIDNFVS